jgi:hypothetical protein
LKRREISLGELVLWMSCEGEVFDKSSDREQREKETEVRGLDRGFWVSTLCLLVLGLLQIGQMVR